MMTQAESFSSVSTRASLRTIAVVGKHPDRHVLDTVLKAEYEVVLIESLTEAYTHIKRIAPQVVIVCLDINDLDGVEVLSMLNLDKATAKIPVVTYLTGPNVNKTEDEESSDLNHEAVRHMVMSTMN
jgi:CheY-like chemotaxis protein